MRHSSELRTIWLTACVLTGVVASAMGQTQFTRVNDAMGVTGQDGYVTERAVAWGDYDGDGFPDLLLSDGGSRLSRRFHNNAGLGFSGTGFFQADEVLVEAVWGDYDNDGDLDYLYDQSLYRNDQGVFVDVSSSAGIEPFFLLSTTWVDYDVDGFLDLCATRALIRNNGNGTFSLSGITFPGTSSGHAWGDYDWDGDMDVFFTGTAGEHAKLFRNDRVLGFVDISQQAGLNDLPLISQWGPAWGDFDRDGDMDIFVANDGSDWLLLNYNGVFVNVAGGSGVAGAPTSNSRIGSWADYDNDGYLDLAVNHTSGGTTLFHNNGNGTFADATSTSGFVPTQGYGLAWADYDRDGDLDLYASDADCFGNFPSYSGHLYRNNLSGAGHNWVHVRLKGVLANAMGVGARVSLTAGGQEQRRVVDGGSGGYSQNSALVEFGIGGASSVNQIQIRWPSGTVETRVNPPINTVHTFVECTEFGSVVPSSMQTWTTPRPWPGTMYLHFRFSTTQPAYQTRVQYRLNGGAWATADCSSPGSTCLFDDVNRVYELQVIIPCEQFNVSWQAKFEGCAGWTPSWSPIKTYKTQCIEGALTAGGEDTGALEFSARAECMPDLSGVRLILSTAEAGSADIDLYDLSGRHVAELARGEAISPGTRVFAWRRGSAPKGLYFYRVRFGRHVETGKVFVLR